MKDLKIEAESPAPMHPEAMAILVTASFTNPGSKPVALKSLKLQHVTMGEFAACPVPEALKGLPGAEWLDPAGFTLEPGATRKGRLAFAMRKKIEVSLPCALEAEAGKAVVRGGVKCVPIKDLEEAAKKAAEKAAKASSKTD